MDPNIPSQPVQNENPAPQPIPQQTSVAPKTHRYLQRQKIGSEGLEEIIDLNSLPTCQVGACSIDC